jgi:hypothetical protein
MARDEDTGGNTAVGVGSPNGGGDNAASTASADANSSYYDGATGG